MAPRLPDLREIDGPQEFIKKGPDNICPFGRMAEKSSRVIHASIDYEDIPRSLDAAVQAFCQPGTTNEALVLALPSDANANYDAYAAVSKALVKLLDEALARLYSEIQRVNEARMHYQVLLLDMYGPDLKGEASYLVGLNPRSNRLDRIYTAYMGPSYGGSEPAHPRQSPHPFLFLIWGEDVIRLSHEHERVTLGIKRRILETFGYLYNTDLIAVPPIPRPVNQDIQKINWYLGQLGSPRSQD